MMKKVLAFLAFGLITVSIITTFWLLSHKPQYSGKLTLKGLQNNVSIYRDEYGVPHIISQNEKDAHRALGYVMAQDRLFQMEVLRRIVNGELSEVLGKDALKHDILLRKLMLRKTMDQFLINNEKTFDPNVLEMSQAFLEGVNYFIEKDDLPIEFKLLGIKPRPFQLAEVLGVSGYLALSFAEGLIADPLISDLSKTFGPEKMRELFIQHNGDKNRATNNLQSSHINKDWYKNLISSLDFFENHLGLFHGSNSWVLSGERSQSGHPLLANDPHVAFSNPGVWYEAHIKSPTYEIYGHFIPLVPFPAMGHNYQRGWAVTMAEMDDLDLYQEKIDWDKKLVMYKNQWQPMISHKEIIKVKGEDDYKFTLYQTPHGPLIDGTEFAPVDAGLALKWSYHHPENDIATAIYKLGHAQSVEDYKKAVAYGATPGLNISWADKNGEIGWHVMAKIPLRPDGVSGRQILNGWSGEHEYLRYLNINENPHQYNPKSGVIVTANYHPEWTQIPVEGYWQPSERFEYINKLLSKNDKWTLNALRNVQTNQFIPNGKSSIQKLLSIIGKGNNESERTAIDYLSKWKGDSDKESIAASIWHQWQKEVIQGILLDEFGKERLAAFNKAADGWNFFKNIINNPNSKFWDNIHTPELETRNLIIMKAFRIAMTKLKKQLGDDVNKWQWGKLHTVEYKHIFGSKSPLNHIFNLGPYPAGGGANQIDNMSTKRDQDNFLVTLGPSVRRLIDFARPGESLGVLPTGNSGRLFSPFYDDQVEMFLERKYRPQLLNIETVRQQPHHFLELIP